MKIHWKIHLFINNYERGGKRRAFVCSLSQQSLQTSYGFRPCVADDVVPNEWNADKLSLKSSQKGKLEKKKELEEIVDCI